MEIKRCPFCVGDKKKQPRVKQVDTAIALCKKLAVPVYAVVCGRCKSMGPRGATEKIAIQGWNNDYRRYHEQDD